MIKLVWKELLRQGLVTGKNQLDDKREFREQALQEHYHQLQEYEARRNLEQLCHIAESLEAAGSLESGLGSFSLAESCDDLFK